MDLLNGDSSDEGSEASVTEEMLIAIVLARRATICGHPNVGPFPMGTDVRSGWQDRRVRPSIRNGHLSNFRPSPK